MVACLDNDEGRVFGSINLARLINKDLPVIVCVGSDRVVSDMVAPLTAEYLVDSKVNAYVYGRLNNPIMASNLHSAFRHIMSKHSTSQIIVIDAGLGKVSDIGKVRINKGGIMPAAGFGYSNAIYGDISIMPIVSTIGIDEKLFLSASRLTVINDTAKSLASVIIKAIEIAKKL